MPSATPQCFETRTERSVSSSIVQCATRRNSSGDIVPYYTNDGAAKVTCPYRSDYQGGQRVENPRRWDWLQVDGCYDTSGGVDRQLICYAALPCKEAKPQWTTKLVIENKWYDWQVHYLGWTGGLDPARVAPWDGDILMAEPYEGKFCLQKAALKALSRQGWELIEPYDAFTAETWKVIRSTPLL